MSEIIKNKYVKKSIELAGRTLSLETGKLAPQANMAVRVQYGETVVLAAVTSNEPRESSDFFPLRVDYEEKLYAGGFIKSSRFIKREGRPRDEAIIAGRQIDHAIRPLFPKDFMNEVQVIATVLSVSEEGDPETLALIAAAAALHASDIPWNGPVGTVRVAGNKKEGSSEVTDFVLNPHYDEENGHYDLNFVMTGTDKKIVAMEGEFNVVSEDSYLKGIEYGLKYTGELVKFIDEFAKEVGKVKTPYVSAALSKAILDDVDKLVGKEIRDMVKTPMDKLDRVDAYRDLITKVETELEGKYKKSDMSRAFNEVEKNAVRKLVLEDKKRPDGRKFDEVRPLSIEVSVLPRVHGSALFSRGLTQALTITTLGSSSLEQLIQHMYGEETKRYMHHYNAAPYSVGETGMLKGPGRREIGHGALAEKALRPVIPSKEEFPYAIRVVSEVLSQNGSSSMASTCGSTLSLMDAGVPIKAPVAGVAIGIVADAQEKEFVVLTDIAGVEDFNGFMDFKLTGTKEGITAVQMDIKLKGLPLPLFSEIVAASKKARLGILDEMEKVISSPRTELSKHAPRIAQVKIEPSMIGTLIGPGGKMIRKITEESGATIDIDDDGIVSIAATSPESMQKALKLIKDLTYMPKEGDIVEGEVFRIEDFGAFLQISPNKDGLIHVSEMAHSFVDDPRNLVKIGDRAKAKVIEVSPEGKIRLSIKALTDAPQGAEGGAPRPPRTDGSRPYTPRSGGSSGSRPYSPREGASRGRPSDRGYNPRDPRGGRDNRGGRDSHSRGGGSSYNTRPAPQSSGFRGR